MYTGLARAGDHGCIAIASAFVVFTWVLWLCLQSMADLEIRDKITAAGIGYFDCKYIY
jgi:hypothetical protein